jgi:surfeit locus 1 family protein
VPLERSDGPPILVDRGWVPISRRHAIAMPPGEVSVEGYVRPAVRPGVFSATDDPVGRHFYTLDPVAIGAALGVTGLAPFTLVALGTGPPELYPDPARHLPRPPNNHLSYAITWFGLAVALLVVFVVWASRVIRA